MRTFQKLLAVAVVVPCVASAQVVSLTGQSVSGQADIFAATLGAVPAFPGGGGVLPNLVSFSAGAGRQLTFANVAGSVSCDAGSFTGPDGGPVCSGGTNINGFNNISGIVASGRSLFLAGLFLDGSLPPSQVASLTYGAGDFGFASASPLLGQLFYIGDGLTGTGSGATQLFNVPTTATRLYIGFADAFAFSGDPGYYNDNLGSLTYDLNISVGVSAVPEPATFALLGGGLLVLGGVVRRRRTL